MPLITPLPADHDTEVAELAKFFNETLGFCPNSVLTMQRRPAIAKAFIGLNKAVMDNQGRVTSDLKRLIGYVASLTAGCQYCQAHTIRAAERYGAAADQLAHVWEYRTHPAFSPGERAALDVRGVAGEGHRWIYQDGHRTSLRLLPLVGAGYGPTDACESGGNVVRHGAR